MLGLWSRSKETDQASAAREARTAKSLDTLGKSQTDMQLPDTSALLGTNPTGELITSGLPVDRSQSQIEPRRTSESQNRRSGIPNFFRCRIAAKWLAYLHIVNPALITVEKGVEPEPQAHRMLDLIRGRYRGTLIMCGGFDQNTAEAWLTQGKADLIAFGRKFLANPDLPKRFRQHAALNADDPSTYYGGGPKGYTDYPTLAQEIGEEPKPCLDDRWR
jgi:hypothetical protein